MIRIIAARLVDLGFVLIGISLLVFCMIRFIPGDAVAIMLGANTEVTPDRVAAYLKSFAAHADADELILAHGAPTVDERLRSVDLTADVWGMA